MEKAVVMGCVCVVVSSLTPEEMKRFACYYPEAMTLKGMNFSLRLDDGPGSLSEEEARFSRTTTADGKATITILLDPDVEDKAAFVRERIGSALLKLDMLEKQMVGMKEELEETENAASELFTLM